MRNGGGGGGGGGDIVGNATVHLGYLSSYENMGVASVSCLAGCVCTRLAMLPYSNVMRRIRSLYNL